jgi:hypothetical protein
MKTVSLLLMESDPEAMTDLEFIGAFGSDFELVEWLWSELKQRPGFSAWPVGGDRERAEDVEFQSNVAELQLRPYYPMGGAYPALRFAGLGPSSIRKVWVKQHNLEGDFGWLVATYLVADIQDAQPAEYKELRRVLSNGGMVYAHITSALGQRIEEDLTHQAARGVQQAITSLRTGSAVMHNPSEDELFVCEYCATAPIPGVVFPIASNGNTDHAYVEQCDECQKFRSDLDAAAVLGHMFRLTVQQTGSGRAYIDGMTFDEAEEWRKKHLRPPVQS